MRFKGPTNLLSLSGIRGKGSKWFVAILDNFYVKDALCASAISLTDRFLFIDEIAHPKTGTPGKNAEIDDP